MQGTHKNGLPRPYYMKPVSKKNSPYDKMANSFFNNNRRRLLGYIFLLLLCGTCVFLMSQELKPVPDPIYEVVDSNDYQKPKQGNIDKMVDNLKNADKESENAGLANNMAQGSKGDVGVGVLEAPKGGIANEAPIVGNDDAERKAKKKKTYKATKDTQGAVKDSDVVVNLDDIVEDIKVPKINKPAVNAEKIGGVADAPKVKKGDDDEDVFKA